MKNAIQSQLYNAVTAVIPSYYGAKNYKNFSWP